MKDRVIGILGLSLLLGAGSLSGRAALAANNGNHGNGNNGNHANGNHGNGSRGVPEIELAGLAGAVVLVAGGTLLVRSRRHHKAD